jgi:hypothetical protein
VIRPGGLPFLHFISIFSLILCHLLLQISAVTWLVGSLIMAINIYYLVSGFIKLLLHSHFKVVVAVFLGIFGFAGIGIYLAGIAYLVFRTNKESTHLLTLTTPESRQMGNEAGNASMYSLQREDIVSMQLPQRRNTEDLD